MPKVAGAEGSQASGSGAGPSRVSGGAGSTAAGAASNRGGRGGSAAAGGGGLGAVGVSRLSLERYGGHGWVY